MKKTLQIIFFLFISCAFSLNVDASHLMGADIQWKYLGSDTYQITIKIYRDCRGIPLPAQAATISSDSCSGNYSFTGGPGTATIRDITPTCSSTGKPCNPPNTSITTSLPVAIEEQSFTFLIYLGGSRANCCWYKISWDQSARNGAITTGYAGDLIVNSWLNRCFVKGDNSPEFGNDPLTIKCAGQDVLFNHQVTDADGDSLSYAMSPPLGFSYTSPYSYTYPLTCLGGNAQPPNPSVPTGFYLNPVTGDLVFRPMQVQTTVLKIEVSEWRKDSGMYKIIGKTSRDMEFIILGNCNNKPPTLTGPYSYSVCANSQICIPVKSDDQDPTDSTTISWNKGIPAGTFSTNNGTARLASGTFCWTPADSNASALPYFFTVTVADNHCFLYGTNTRSYLVFVSKPKTSAITVTACKNYTINGITYTSSGVYKQALAHTCPDTLIINLTINNTPVNDTVTQSVNILTAKAVGAIYQWVKCPLYFPLPGENGQSFTAKAIGDYAVIITQNGCTDTSDCLSVTSLGLDKNSFSRNIRISPNPTYGIFNIHIESPANNMRIEIFNELGELVFIQTKVKEENEIDLRSLADGVYFIKTSNEKFSSSQKIIKE